jgi:hypothetical protein
MEVTLTEMWLFVWAIAATAYAFKRDGDANSHMQMLRVIFEDKKARVHILQQFDDLKELHDANQSKASR